jgi:hypothetical protein
MTGRRRSAQALERRIRARTRAQLRRARAEGTLHEVELPAGVVRAEVRLDARTLVGVELEPLGVAVSCEIGPVRYEREHRGRGRPQKSELAREARALAEQREFQHPDGEPNKTKIAKQLRWNERGVGRALEGRRK